MRFFACLSALTSILFGATTANAVILIGGSVNNGNLDAVAAVEIIDGFFQPKPTVWQNIGTRSISGAYEDELASEPWAGPSPTPVTTDGSGLASPNGCSGLDCAVFFKPFTGTVVSGAATGHLQQDNPAIAGWKYTFSGWAGAEASYLATTSQFAIDFLDVGNVVIGGASVDLVAGGLFDVNGLPFNYKKYSVEAFAPAGTATVRARISMIGAMANPAGGGQAFVVDDFTLEAISVPEPLSASLAATAFCGLIIAHRRRRTSR